MSDNILFEVEPIKHIKQKKFICRRCYYSYKHEYSKTHYCKIQYDKKTAYGNKIIKMNDSCCNGFFFNPKIK
jgi:hypothetical protein